MARAHDNLRFYPLCLSCSLGRGLHAVHAGVVVGTAVLQPGACAVPAPFTAVRLKDEFILSGCRVLHHLQVEVVGQRLL